MKVYVVYSKHDSKIHGVYSTREGASQCVAKLFMHMEKSLDALERTYLVDIFGNFESVEIEEDDGQKYTFGYLERELDRS